MVHRITTEEFKNKVIPFPRKELATRQREMFERQSFLPTNNVQ